jgi:hypothetical protein
MELSKRGAGSEPPWEIFMKKGVKDETNHLDPNHRLHDCHPLRMLLWWISTSTLSPLRAKLDL